ncbi:elongator complex protein 6 [Vipera latastei]
MFVALNELLGVSVEQPERSALTLLCATRTDAGFLVHHFLSFYLRAGCKVCFLALVQSFSHYSFVAQKLGVNLLTAKEQNQLVFFEGLKSANQVLFSDGQECEDPNPFQFISGDGSDLKGLYDFVRTSVNPPAGGHRWKFPVLIVDDLGVLLSLGVRLVDLLNFVHYCRVTVNAELKGNLVFAVQSREDSEDDENETLVKALRHHTTCLLWAEGLPTGPCQEVHGQLTILEKDSRQSGGAEDLRRRLYQYKILDRNVAFFARGMSPAVL